MENMTVAAGVQCEERRTFPRQVENEGHRGYAVIGLYSPKNDMNVGGVLRAAHCYGAEMLVMETPRSGASRFTRQASNVTKAHRHIPTIIGQVLDHRPYDCQLVVIELIDGAIPLPDFVHPERAMYVFGPEDGSVPMRICERAQHIVSIPTTFCMNLAATANVVLYDRMAKRAKARHA